MKRETLFQFITIRDRHCFRGCATLCAGLFDLLQHFKTFDHFTEHHLNKDFEDRWPLVKDASHLRVYRLTNHIWRTSWRTANHCCSDRNWPWTIGRRACVSSWNSRPEHWQNKGNRDERTGIDVLWMFVHRSISLRFRCLWSCLHLEPWILWWFDGMRCVENRSLSHGCKDIGSSRRSMERHRRREWRSVVRLDSRWFLYPCRRVDSPSIWFSWSADCPSRCRFPRLRLLSYLFVSLTLSSRCCCRPWTSRRRQHSSLWTTIDLPTTPVSNWSLWDALAWPDSRESNVQTAPSHSCCQSQLQHRRLSRIQWKQNRDSSVSRNRSAIGSRRYHLHRENSGGTSGGEPRVELTEWNESGMENFVVHVVGETTDVECAFRIGHLEDEERIFRSSNIGWLITSTDTDYLHDKRIANSNAAFSERIHSPSLLATNTSHYNHTIDICRHLRCLHPPLRGFRARTVQKWEVTVATVVHRVRTLCDVSKLDLTEEYIQLHHLKSKSNENVFETDRFSLVVIVGSWKASLTRRSKAFSSVSIPAKPWSLYPTRTASHSAILAWRLYRSK